MSIISSIRCAKFGLVATALITVSMYINCNDAVLQLWSSSQCRSGHNCRFCVCSGRQSFWPCCCGEPQTSATEPGRCFESEQQHRAAKTPESIRYEASSQTVRHFNTNSYSRHLSSCRSLSLSLSFTHLRAHKDSYPKHSCRSETSAPSCHGNSLNHVSEILLLSSFSIMCVTIVTINYWVKPGARLLRTRAPSLSHL